ncbi:prepilin-type N-terminal cleavage/methylation domain-containing protein [Agrilutibacter solisilvae]|uniref:PilW family protein n=1 Tax=Agrilutibacter solisilvae TaxID=2763317 RepID=A0A974XXG8_9GAMM|nr:PilW family protein [Lysobacter solisilvae]QSX77473.1 PilW family protein [Lysobacter solisilvae]
MSAQRLSGARRTQGFTLIELMIGMVLGLVVLAAVGAVFESNKHTYTATESLGRVQESARVAFELLARDVRESAGNACERDLPVYNVLNDTAPWYANFNSGLFGYDGATAFPGLGFGTGVADRVNGTDAIELKSSVSDGINVVSHDPSSAQLKVSTVNHNLFPGDIVMACDFGQAAIFQVTGANSGTNDTIVHNNGTATVLPGNCSKGLGLSLPANCSTNGNAYAFGCYRGEWESGKCKNNRTWPATVSKLRMTRWYIGNNARGGRSLYQATLRNTGGVLGVDRNEIATGVEEMRLRYLLRNGLNYVEASAVTATNWTAGEVLAVSIDLTVRGTDVVGTDGKPLQRRITHTVAIRNRAP